MKHTLRTLALLGLLLAVVPLNAQSRKAQKQYFPRVIQKMKVYLGADAGRLLDQCPECTDMKTGESFRTIYSTPLKDKQFATAVFYVSTQKSELYEMILVAKEGVDIETVAASLLGPPNQGDEWRFSPAQTRQDFTLAAWTFRNKLIIAGDLKGSEWEPGFND
ncbi:hypothetical protein [Lewinella sp. W8]|uniref:hypothetical protein n=1 Tax=Lewinella sp. W8 TaxID=2528208 RepID=UPI0010677BB5|nr:hypothetical protein [Lewinella sp. W8]MTB51126.1 hypothetical protein [Lewinella sp. W8]